MIGTFLTLDTFLSATFFPWPLTAVLALITAPFEPLVPLAVGIFIDLLQYVPHAYALPSFSIGGAVLTALAFFVRSRLNPSIIGR